MRNLLQRALDRFAQFLLFVCVLLLLFGGWQFQLPKGRVEIGQINAWGILLLLSLWGLARFESKSKAWSSLESLIKVGVSRSQKWLLWGILSAFFALMIAHGLRFLTLNTNLWDMGIVHAALTYPFEGKWLSCAICRNETYLGEHLTFTFTFLAPFTAFLKSDFFIFALQKLVVLGSLFWFCKKGPLKNQPQLQFWFFIFVLANEGLRGGLLFDFREDILMYGLFLVSAWAISNGRAFILFLSVIACLFSKENAFATVMMISVPILFAQECPWNRKQRLLWAGLIVTLSIVYLWVSFKYFMPLFHGQTGQSHTALMDRFPGMGRTPEELVQNFLLHPIQFISAFSANFWNLRTLNYVIMVSLVSVFFGWRKWAWLAPALPALFFNLISSGPGQRSMAYHYDLILVCWGAVAMAWGLADLAKNPQQQNRKLAWGLVLAFASFGRSPLYYAFERIQVDGKKLSSGVYLQTLQPKTPIAADSFIMSNLTHLKDIRFFNPLLAPDDSRQERIRKFLLSSPDETSLAEGRGPSDALTWVIRPDEPDQSWLIQELVQIGGRETYRSHEKLEDSVVVIIETDRPLYEIWCEKEQLCSKSLQTRKESLQPLHQ